MAQRRKSTPPSPAPRAKTSPGRSGAGPAGGAPPGARRGGRGEPPAARPPEDAALHEVAQERYLHYALSVITSRALPDVRDGLKPVQRRILYTMWQQGITATSKHRKCAKVVGDVMGSFHPHGDASIYDALVRVAQPFSLRVPLVDGSGNFGSLDGDPAAAMRYTECRLTAPAEGLLTELDHDTVHFKPNYDGTRTEPVVLPARLPNLLVNGASGIAVGMATSIPPHNPEEVVQAAVRLLDALTQGKELSARELCRTLKGPDFPTGGQIVSGAEELKLLYETGQGSVKVRGTWEAGPSTRAARVVYITSIPYMVNKATLVERIAEVVMQRKMPLILDVRDVSTEDVRIELSLKPEADPHKVLAYLFKNTPLQVNFPVNLTVLVPTENPEVGRPERLDLSSLLWHFLQFRLEVVTRRLEHELRQLERRIHILAGLEQVFDALDEILRIIRKSDGKADAARKIIQRFGLDEEQTDAILELKLYRLARLEIQLIQEELGQKRKRARDIKKLLSDGTHAGRWSMVRAELLEAGAALGKAALRRTAFADAAEEPEFTADELIVAEDNHVLVTRDGWIKRQKEIKDPAQTRLREGDGVLACVAGSTRATLVLWSNLGSAYTLRIADVPATTGYGEPVQKLFKLRDGEGIVAATSLDPRLVGTDLAATETHLPASYMVAATTDGFVLAFGLEGHLEPSTKAGRRFARLAEGARVLGVELVHGDETLLAASKKRRALLCKVSEVSFLTGVGRGVTLIKLDDDDELLGFRTARDDRDTLVARGSQGGEQRINTGKYRTVGRGGRGFELMSRGALVEIVREAPAAPPPFAGEG